LIAGADLKKPPHSLECEQAVLGGLMIDPGAWVRVQGAISEHDFYLKPHKILFRALMVLFNAGEPADVVTVSEFLKKKQLLDSAGGISLLAVLVRDTPSAANIVAYATIVREKSLLRQLIGVAGKISELAFSADADAKSVIAEAESAIFEVGQQGLRGKKGFSRIQDILKEVLDTMENNLVKPVDGVLGVATGFSDLDVKTSGLQGGNLVIVAGRPSMGKTAFAMNVAEHVAISGGLPVAIFSMEMQVKELGQRILSNQSSVGLKKIREAWTIDDSEWPAFSGALLKLGEGVSMFVDDTPALTIGDIRSRCMRMQSEIGGDGLGLILIDYIQLMGSELKGDNRNNQIEEITRGLKRLAKDFDVPVVALSQLNRNLESRPNKRPVMSDLRESGGIEQDADIILLLYRDEVYNEESPAKGIAEVIVAKQRNGALGTVRLGFEGSCARFLNLDRGYQDYE